MNSLKELLNEVEVLADAVSRQYDTLMSLPIDDYYHMKAQTSKENLLHLNLLLQMKLQSSLIMSKEITKILKKNKM